MNSIWSGVLCRWFEETSSFLENDKLWGTVKCPTMAWNRSISKLFGTIVSTRAFSRTSLCVGEILRSSNMDMCVGIFFNWSTRLYCSFRGVDILEVFLFRTYLDWTRVVTFTETCSCLSLIFMTLIWFLYADMWLMTLLYAWFIRAPLLFEDDEVPLS